MDFKISDSDTNRGTKNLLDNIFVMPRGMLHRYVTYSNPFLLILCPMPPNFSNISKSRLVVIVTILVVAALVAIGLGLGLGLSNRNSGTSQSGSGRCPDQATPSPKPSSTTASPLYYPPSESKEGHYRFAAVAADAEECSQIGT